MEWEWPGSNRKIIEKWPRIGQAMGKKWLGNGKKFKMGYEFKCKIYK